MLTGLALGKSAGRVKSPSGRAGDSHIGHLYLHEKDPVSWEIIEDGAWGKLKYNVYGPTFDFVFNGHGLEAGLDYVLIYYPDPWPGTDLICLGEGSLLPGRHNPIMVRAGERPTPLRICSQ